MHSWRVMARVNRWLPPVVYMAYIFYSSSQSNPLPDVTTRVSDKLLHALAYAGLAGLLCRALLGEGLRSFPAAVVAALFASAYGATDEYHQLFVPLLEADVWDWIVDALGASVGATSYVGWIDRLRPRAR